MVIASPLGQEAQDADQEDLPDAGHERRRHHAGRTGSNLLVMVVLGLVMVALGFGRLR